MPQCIACEGKGRSSRGGVCIPCNGTGKLKDESKEVSQKVVKKAVFKFTKKDGTKVQVRTSGLAKKAGGKKAPKS